MLIDSEELKRFCFSILQKAGVPETPAQQCVSALVEADLEGTNSHGVMRLPIYLSSIERGQINPKGEVKVKQTAAATAIVDGGNTLGQVVSTIAMETAVHLARDAGIASTAAYNSNHFGAASYYTNIAARAGMVGICTTNSPPALPAWGGREAYLGTNPMAIAFPTSSGSPLSIDLSMSVVARGKIIQAAKAGQPIPEGWAVDYSGRSTTDPKAALSGALLPVGGSKGFALALGIEVLSSLLSGAAFGPHVISILEQETKPANVGHWFLAIDISKFITLERFQIYLDLMLQEMRESTPAIGFSQIRMPGERREILRRQQLAVGLTLPEETVKALNEWATKFGISPLYINGLS